MSPDFPPADDDDLLAAGRRALRELPDAPEWMILRAAAGALPVLRGAAGTRQLLFSAAEYDVDLRIAPAEQAWSIAGQVLGPDDAAQVLLTGPDGVARPAQPLDELGGFHIDGLAAGRYRLELQLADRVIELPPVDVGPDAAADG